MTTETPQKRASFRLVDLILIVTGSFFALVAGCLLLFLAFPELMPQTAVGKPASFPLPPTEDPLQSNMGNETAIIWEKNDKTWTIIPKARYEISARVLSSKRYYTDWQAPVIPFDLALGWGEISDTAVDEWINWRQTGRWYYYDWEDDSPYDRYYIRGHSANVHIIPANENLATAVASIRENDLVYLAGWLVDVDAISDDGWKYWVQTSLIRTDSGGGACEILYVERLVYDGMEYK